MSLLALSSVVSALAGKGAMRVPFRDSKLTRLLQSSLAGNCKASFVVTVRGEKKNVEEAINTLKFAQRASSVSATVIKNEDARQAKGRGPNKALEAELASAKLALAEFHKTMAGEAKVKDSLMAQVQTLLHEMQQLQRDGEDAKRQARRDSQAGPNPAKHANMERYVKELEARNAVLEEENRLLRQRDIMYRLNATAAATGDAGSDAKINFKTDNLATFNPMATAGFASQLDADLHPLKRQSTREFAKGHAPGQVLVRRNSNSFTKHQSSTAKSRWGTLRVAFRLAKKRSAKVHPKAYVDPTPKGRAATYIQKIARGYIVRKELSYWDDTYFDDIYGYDYDYD